MTTEIAVLNRLGVALATDSAVTISGGGRTKVFDSADKLFELSDRHPVGIMINGNMDCISVPWEILVKGFRETEGGESRDSTDNWLSDFLSYVERHETLTEGADGAYTRQIAEQELEFVQAIMFEQFSAYMDSPEARRSRPKTSFDLPIVLQNALDDRLAEFDGVHRADSLESQDEEALVSTLAEQVVDILSGPFPERVLTDKHKTSFATLVAKSRLARQSSEFATGIVIAGYGRNDTFPTAHAVEVDGRVQGQLKFSQFERESIAASDDKGRVLPFAQTDVIQRLLGGADPRFVKQTADFIGRAVERVGNQVEQALRSGRTGTKKVAGRQQLIAEIAALVASEYETDVADNLRKQFEREFDRMVALMPKQELIELGEALVSITAAERKATTDEGTVGGPIDVAMITKHEGFVWIKRKHYFSKDLNPRFFWRKYGMLGGEPR